MKSETIRVVTNMQANKRRVVLIDAAADTSEEAVKETCELIAACNMELFEIWQQRLKEINHLSFIGSGKVEEFNERLQQCDADMIIFQQPLSALQANYLSEAWNIAVIDRSELIIEIFESRSHTQEAKLQVRKAKMEKQHSRLIGKTKSLGRQGGGRNKGSGEKQLELNRRLLKQRIRECERQIKALKKQHSLQYQRRNKQRIPVAALIGYTNAGKSTLTNALLSQSRQSVQKHVLAKDCLFATLDTAMRRIALPYAPDILIVDTVGFVSNLPHELIDAFHATLDEVRHADYLLHIIDHSSTARQTQIEATLATLETLKAQNIPRIDVYNKCDLSDISYPKTYNDAVYISAKQEASVLFLSDRLAEAIYGPLEPVTFVFPHEKSAQLAAVLSYLKLTTQENHTSEVVLHGFMRKMLISDYVNYVKF